MSLRIIEGPPRSGKSYYGVYLIYNTYHNKKGQRLKKYKDLKIVTNIENLQLPHISLKEWLEKFNNDPLQLFSLETQRKIYEKHGPVVYLIDEAQMYFPDNLKEKTVGNWLQYHAHFGQDVFLLTQAITLLPRGFGYLAEEVVRALPRSVSPLSWFTLHYKTITLKGDVLGQFSLRKNQKIFDLYKSQDAQEVNSTKSPMARLLLVTAVLAVLGFIYGIYTFMDLFSPDDPTPPPVAVSPQPTAAPTSTPDEQSPHIVATYTELYYSQTNPKNHLFIPEIERVRLSYLQTDDDIWILFDDEVISLDLFPYPVDWRDNYLFAFIPTTHYRYIKSEPDASHRREDERPSEPSQNRLGVFSSRGIDNR